MALSGVFEIQKKNTSEILNKATSWVLSLKKSHPFWDDDPTSYSVETPAAKLHNSHVNDCNQCHK